MKRLLTFFFIGVFLGGLIVYLLIGRSAKAARETIIIQKANNDAQKYVDEQKKKLGIDSIIDNDRLQFIADSLADEYFQKYYGKRGD